MKKINISIEERLGIHATLPPTGGNKEAQRAYNVLRKTLYPSTDERKEHGLQQNPQTGAFLSNSESIFEVKEIEFEDFVLEELKKLIETLEANNNFPSWGVEIHDQLENLFPKKKAKKKD